MSSSTEINRPWSPVSLVRLNSFAKAEASSPSTVQSHHKAHAEECSTRVHSSAGKNSSKRLELDNHRVGLVKELSTWFLNHQAGLSFNLIALLLLTHMCMPKARPFTCQFFTLSHYNPHTGNYAVGGSDLYFVVFCVVLLTGLRATFLDHVLSPLAVYWQIPNKSNIVRFAEQTWLLCYYAVFYSLGTYIYCNSTYFLNMKELWTDYPTRQLPGIVKFYVLGQLSFWVQQVLVIYIEERRKDHWQMLAHHFVTIGLIASCYAYHFTSVGNLILITMDVVDIVFPIAKCLKYFNYTALCNVAFGVFVVSWFVTRHVVFVYILYCMWRDMPNVIPVGCFNGSHDDLTGPFEMAGRKWSQLLEPFRNPSGTICYSDNVRWTYLAALGFLQVLTIFWFFMIMRVVARVIQGVGADDPRSDNEEEESEPEDTASLEKPMVMERKT